jgi:hypothetical protein
MIPGLLGCVFGVTGEKRKEKGEKKMLKTRKAVVRALLAILNSEWLNPTPCKYEFVGNVDAFSREDIEATLRHEPEMSLRAYLDLADRFKACPVSRVGVSVIEADGSYSLNRDFR